MTDSYYIRIRGRVAGPYAAEQLRSMSQRGQFSRMHEVSPDGAEWSRATTHPDLFLANDIGKKKPQPEDSFGQPEQAESIPVSNAPPPSLPSDSPWHYSTSSGRHGPVDFAYLQFLIHDGQVKANDLVWRSGMSIDRLRIACPFPY